MKKLITHSLERALSFLLLLLVINSNVSCSKGDKPAPNPTPTDVCPNLPGIQTDASLCPAIIPAPTGTVVFTSSLSPNSSGIYGKKDTIYFHSFTNTDSIWINNVLMNGISGNWPVGPLYTTTPFYVKAKGKGGVLNYTLSAVVIQDPKFIFLATGKFHFDSLLFKPYNGTEYIKVPTSADCPLNEHTFYSSGLTSAPGNIEWTVYGNCAGNPGNPGDSVMHYWYFNSQDHLFWHGVEFDQFIMNGNGFILHVSSKINVGGVDYFDQYKWFHTRFP